jgi:pentatricopeptide repeat protein
MGQQRQLAAILFTDIEGYTAIMQQDERRALELKDRHRAVIQKEHELNNGRIIQYYGDGTLSVFRSAVQAVQCALSMQLQFQQDPRVPVRMGLHIGDVIVEEKHVFGDGVNMASRIESLGVAGSVLLSDKVHDEILNHPEFKTVSMGVYQLKNIQRIVEVFALDHKGLVVPRSNSLVGKTEPRKKATGRAGETELAIPPKASIPGKSIAVLPFVNMSNDPEQEFFSSGIAEEIINALSSLKELKVAGRTSSFQFSDQQVDLASIREKLGVSTVLEGSVRKQDNRLRITVQLINTEDGFHLWSEKYDRNIDDLFAIQDEIAMAVQQKLRLTLLENDRDTMTKTYTNNMEAYELYLKGRFYINRRGASIITGIRYFQQAIEMDPLFALAHAGYADGHLLSAFYGLVPPKPAMVRAKESAEIAIRLDPTLPEPYCSLGYYYACAEWNWAEAERHFLTSIDINPKFAQGHLWYGLVYLAWVKGDFARAEKHGLIAKELDPLSSITYAVHGAILYAAGKNEEALASCREGLKLDGNSFLCRIYEGNVYVAQGRYEEAVVAFTHAMKISNRHHFAQNGLITSYCRLGDYNKARALMENLKDRGEKVYVSSVFTGLSAAFLNDIDEAYAFIEKGVEERDPVLVAIKYEHWVPDNIRENPRFNKLLEKIGFPETVTA